MGHSRHTLWLGVARRHPRSRPHRCQEGAEAVTCLDADTPPTATACRLYQLGPESTTLLEQVDGTTPFLFTSTAAPLTSYAARASNAVGQSGWSNVLFVPEPSLLVSLIVGVAGGARVVLENADAALGLDEGG